MECLTLPQFALDAISLVEQLPDNFRQKHFNRSKEENK